MKQENTARNKTQHEVMSAMEVLRKPPKGVFMLLFPEDLGYGEVKFGDLFVGDYIEI